MRLDRRSILLGSASALGLLSLGAFGLWARNPTRASVNPVPPGAEFPRLPIGMNLAGIADWEPGFPFKNLFFGARSWLTRNRQPGGAWDTKSIQNFDLDENGYPLEVPLRVPGTKALQVPFTLIPNVGPPGRYVLLHDGEGEIRGTMGTKVIESKAGRLELEMTNRDGLVEGIVITRSKRGNHIRNIRIVALEYENDDLVAEPFLPEFLEFCEPFHCLRFMDWGATNNSLQEHWSDRKHLTFYTMVAKTGDPEGRWGPPPTAYDRLFAGGVAYELMIQLCNTLKIDMWLCIPHRATDDYISNLATLVRDQLDPSLKVYLEYSNEIWNWQFHQAGWMLRSPLAGALVETRGGFPWKDAARTEGKDHPERIGALFRRAFAIWDKVWASDRERLITVCAVQVGWADTAKRTIRWCMENGSVDAVSPAAYIGPTKEIYQKWAALADNLTHDVVIDDMFALLRQVRNNGGLLEIVDFAKEYSLPYVAYEGGQHIQPEKQAVLAYNNALAAAQVHPRMYDLYVEICRLHRDLDCQMLMHFSSVGKQGTRWGSWGAKASYSISDAASPKMKALLDCNVIRTKVESGTVGHNMDEIFRRVPS